MVLKNYHFQPILKSKEKPIYDWGLEGLRGLAALWVGYSHIFGFKNVLDSSYHPPEPFNSYIHSFQAAHGGVLIFFILSGYVIGLTNNFPFSPSLAKQYLMRRAIRILPIYFISIFFAFLLAPINLQDLIGNLLFLNPYLVTTIPSNPVLWSLNYEVIYYLLFLLIWKFKPSIYLTFIGSFIVAAIGWFIPVFPQFISDYSSGWIFWLSGLWLAWNVDYKYQKHDNNYQYRNIALFSLLMLFLGINNLATGRTLLRGIGFENNLSGMVNFSDLFFLPICLFIISSITQRTTKIIDYLFKASLGILVVNIILVVLSSKFYPTYIMGMIYCLLALAFWKFKIPCNSLSKISFLGKISYGFYVIHVPIMIVVGRINWFSGTPLTFSLKVLLWFFLVIGFAYLLECQFQPKIKLFFQSSSKNKKLI